MRIFESVLLGTFILLILIENYVNARKGSISGSRSSYRGSSSSFRSSGSYVRSYHSSNHRYSSAPSYSDSQIKMNNLAKKILPIVSAYHLTKHLMIHPNHNYYHHNNYARGHFYDYNYRKGFESINGSLCKNNETFVNITFGYFICPIEGFTEEDKFCCGGNETQYCCHMIEDPLEWDDYLIYVLIGFIFICVIILAFSNWCK